MEKIRFALYGYGKVAQLHAKALAACENAQLVSVCGRDIKKAQAFAVQWGIQARASAREMADRDRAQAVIVTTPHPLHAQSALDCLQAGLHTLVEKPMALRVADCDAMIAAANAEHRQLGVISQRRWYPSTRRIKTAIDEGLLGTPLLGQVTILGWRDEAYYRSDPWRGSWAGEGGGVIVNQAPHQLDLLSWFMGSVSGVQGSWINANHPSIEVDDSAVATVYFANGGLGSIFVSNSQKPGIHAKVAVHGSTGASAGVQTDGGAMFIAGMSGVLEPPYNDLWTVPGQEGMLEAWKAEDAAFFSRIDPTWYFFRLQIEDFANAILEGRRPAVNGEDGRETVRIIEGIYRSKETEARINY
ncbi:MAG: Gfo/Idh/MocA family oxidoreductase [Spirochaetia bacterium]|nr:Gfo/Idh/MocA family oxidoreductase [Spirochaetia bacterium]